MGVPQTPAQNEMFPEGAQATSQYLAGIQGNFHLHKAVVDVLPAGIKVLSSETCGLSAWTKTAKVTVALPDGASKRYFLKVVTGKGAKPLAEGEFHSASIIDSILPGFTPKPAGWGTYKDSQSSTQYYFFIGDFHDMDFSTAPEPEEIMAKLVMLHQNAVSPNGMFGFPVPVVSGIMEHTVTWTPSWVTSFAAQLQDVIRYDTETNGLWPDLDAACRQLIDAVIPRLLGALQSGGREITPTLIHGDLWERNVGIDMETGKSIIFDAGSTYAHNEFEFGTWRCIWAYYFNSPSYMRLYQRHIEPSEPAEEWDDRNRLYSIHTHFNYSAGHAGNITRELAFNDILYLCEKYAPLDTLKKYDPAKDISISPDYASLAMKQM